VYFVPD